MTNDEQERRLGKYTIHGELGRGGFATVHKAHDTVLRRDVALKLLHPQLLTDPAFVTRFENDARATAQLDHPRIATIYELGHHDGRLFMAIQLLLAGSLADRIKTQGRLTFSEAVRVVEDIAQALDYAHAAGFVHRDVKPSNILFNTRGDAILTDFGLVKAAESSVIARTTMGGLIGTPAYMAPEIWEGQSDGPGADIYALGCVLFEMLSGELLFTGATPPAVMLKHFQPHRYPDHWPDDTPAAIEAVLERALARDPAARYASAGALAADLRALASRTADPLVERYAALEAALAAHEWDHAARLAQEITARDTGYRNIRALADQAAAGQRQATLAHQVAQWRDTALAAERSGQPDAARAAARQWLEQAPGDSEAQVLLERLASAEPATTPPQPTLVGDRGDVDPAQSAESTPPDVAIGHTTQAVWPAWWPAAAISVGWIIGWIASVWVAWSIEGEQSDASGGTLGGWALGWAVGGLIAGLGLRIAARTGAASRILRLMVGWPLCMSIVLVVGVLLYGTQPDTAIVVLALGGAIAGAMAGAAIRGLGRGLSWIQVSLLGLSWAIGWLLAEASLRDGAEGSLWHKVLEKLASGASFHSVLYSYPNMKGIVLAGGGIVGAALGLGLLWLFDRWPTRR
jgi:hypothetical protein